MGAWPTRGLALARQKAGAFAGKDVSTLTLGALLDTGEAQRARWSHVHDDRWHIPKRHSKNHRAHWVALSRQGLALLRG